MPPRYYYVYVIEGRDGRGRPVFYVGQSALRPEERLRQHKQGKRYCRDCKSKHYVKHVSRLRHELFAQYNPLPSRPAAERVERWLASRLHKKGYNVSGGH